MKPVLLATDGSATAEQATESAIELAQLLQTDLVVATVWDIPYTAVGFAGPPISADLAKLSEEEARTIASAAAAWAEEAGVETRTAVLRGLPVEELCVAAETYKPRFLVIGSHGRGTVKRAIFGSVSTGVLHHARCPVLVVRGVDADAAVVANGVGEHAHA
jgi:nucleotide-binding universal stress UspA family protein